MNPGNEEGIWYRVGNMGWVDMDFNVPSCCPIAKPITFPYIIPDLDRQCNDKK